MWPDVENRKFDLTLISNTKIGVKSTYITQKYESLSFWEPLDDIDDRDALLLSLSVRFRVVKYLLPLKLCSVCLSTLGTSLGMDTLVDDDVDDDGNDDADDNDDWAVRLLLRLSAPVIPFTKFLNIFSMFFARFWEWNWIFKSNYLWEYTREWEKIYQIGWEMIEGKLLLNSSYEWI